MKYKKRRVEERNRKQSLLKIPADREILVSILLMWNFKSSLVSQFLPRYFVKTDVFINELFSQIFNTERGDLNFGGRLITADLSGLICKAFAQHQ